MSELDEHLRKLLQQYGIAEVRRRLRAITRTPRVPPIPRNAREYVSRMNPPMSQKERLLVLAQLFEEKRFLPAAADIRNFFEAYGAAPTKIKARQAAIPLIFRFLSSLSDERLDRIISEGAFSGPSELGPIAEAIKARSGSTGHGGNTTGSSSGKETELEPPRQGRKSNV